MVTYTYSYSGICPYCQLNVHFSKVRINVGDSVRGRNTELDPIQIDGVIGESEAIITAAEKLS